MNLDHTVTLVLMEIKRELQRNTAFKSELFESCFECGYQEHIVVLLSSNDSIEYEVLCLGLGNHLQDFVQRQICRGHNKTFGEDLFSRHRLRPHRSLKGPPARPRFRRDRTATLCASPSAAAAPPLTPPQFSIEISCLNA